jgi:hypothetical protein
MGANFYFDEMLQSVPHKAGRTSVPRRQVEVFTHGGGLFLRIGKVGAENMGSGVYTVELSLAAAEKLAGAIDAGLRYLNLPE